MIRSLSLTIGIVCNLCILPIAWADDSSSQSADRQNACRWAKSAGENGQVLFARKQYRAAVESFTVEAGWSEWCYENTAQIAQAYHHAALAYFHLGEPLKGLAWLSLLPDDKTSESMISQYKKSIDDARDAAGKNINGEYWEYAGGGLWNVVTITPKAPHYRVFFNGYYVGANAMVSGPNSGVFSAILDFDNGKAHYDMTKTDNELNCVYDIQVTRTGMDIQHVSGNLCGFGLNVTAAGHYLKVSG